MTDASATPLDGKVAFVTGAARGIGRGIAIGLARAGADVVVADLASGDTGLTYRLADASAATAVAEEITALGRRSLAVTCDVTDADQVAAAVDRGVGELGGIDLVVNNAGVVHFAPLADFDETRWDQVFDVNVKGVFLVTKAALPHLVARTGAIINISSVAGKRGYPMASAYSGSKFAVVGITQSLAAELGPSGVRVNAVCPGILDTAMWRDHLNGLSSAGCGAEGREAFDNAIDNRIPLGREQTPDDIAHAVLYLATARNVTGVSLNVAGGMEYA